MIIFYWSFLRPLDPQIPHSTKKGFPESSFQYLGFSVGNGKKSLENALTVSIGFHCLFVNFLPMISFMHRAENCVRAVTQKWEFSGLVGGENVCVWATGWHDTLHNEDHHVFISCDHSLELESSCNKNRIMTRLYLCMCLMITSIGKSQQKIVTKGKTTFFEISR